MHWSQMYTPGPATSLRTWSLPFPQNVQRSCMRRSPLLGVRGRSAMSALFVSGDSGMKGGLLALKVLLVEVVVGLVEIASESLDLHNAPLQIGGRVRDQTSVRVVDADDVLPIGDLVLDQLGRLLE